MTRRRLLLLPGLACDAALWVDQLPALAARHWVHVSDVHTRALDLAAMAALLLAEVEGDDLVLIGSSMGGMLAMHVQQAAPRRVRAMALLSTTARPDPPEMLALRGAAIERFRRGEMRAVLEENVAFAFHPDHVRDAALAGRYVEAICRAGAAQLEAQNRAVMARPDLRPALAAVRCPVLVACGDGDALTPPALAREIADAIPGARLEIVAGAGHLLTWEQAPALNALLLGWLDALDAPR